jgi:hypothetical protein
MPRIRYLFLVCLRFLFISHLRSRYFFFVPLSCYIFQFIFYHVFFIYFTSWIYFSYISFLISSVLTLFSFCLPLLPFSFVSCILYFFMSSWLKPQCVWLVFSKREPLRFSPGPPGEWRNSRPSFSVHSIRCYIKSSVIWDITSCSPLKASHCFEGTCCLCFQGGKISKARYQREVGSKQNLLICFILVSVPNKRIPFYLFVLCITLSYLYI